MKTKDITIIILTLVVFVTSYGSKRKIYNARLTDKNGEITIVKDIVHGWIGKYQFVKVFKGQAKLEIPFSKIKSIRVTSYEPVDVSEYRIEVTTTNNKKFSGLFHGGFHGKTEDGFDFGIAIKDVRIVEFLHNY